MEEEVLKHRLDCCIVDFDCISLPRPMCHVVKGFGMRMESHQAEGEVVVVGAVAHFDSHRIEDQIALLVRVLLAMIAISEDHPILV